MITALHRFTAAFLYVTVLQVYAHPQTRDVSDDKGDQVACLARVVIAPVESWMMALVKRDEEMEDGEMEG